MIKVLVIDDDRDMCLLLKKFLERNNFEVTDFISGKKALSWYEENMPDIVLCDLRLEDMSGLEILQKMKSTNPALPFLIITGYSDVRSAVEIMRHGAYDYITKPLFPDEILVTIKQALANGEDVKHQPAKTTTVRVKENADTAAADIEFMHEDYVVGPSQAFQQILKQVKLVAPTNYSVIIYGETGSGKEAVANEIHRHSKRSKEPFIAIDCGALSKELAASELFGHEKGSFTGALNQKTGSFELANGGTIFLDEVANLSYDIQVSLLRVVQERKMRRVGGTKDIELDVRIIVASNEKLWNATQEGKFREDLYHRFNEFSIEIPPLRDRKEDIMHFASYFLRVTNKELEKNVSGFSPEAVYALNNYVWHGNLRELRNVVKRAVLLSDGNTIELKSLPFEITNYEKINEFIPAQPVRNNNVLEGAAPEGQTVAKHPVKSGNLNLKSASIDAEYETILEALKQVNFNKSKAAKLMKIDRKTLYNKIKEYQLLNNK
ncbi:sigma-54-dependent transcriptional regulator [Parafilimonas sp.]|uniref:sigma-54-dependent transcriptional regulator n=1 Tax=Parafilimonas sp. TaxID=1969739 RepID=UPI0039E2802A